MCYSLQAYGAGTIRWCKIDIFGLCASPRAVAFQLCKSISDLCRTKRSCTPNSPHNTWLSWRPFAPSRPAWAPRAAMVTAAKKARL